MEGKILYWEVLFVISFVPARNCLFKVSTLSITIRCKSCSILRMEILTIFWRRSSVFIVLWTYFKLFSNCWLWTGKRLLGSYWKVKHFWRQDQAYHLSLYHQNPTGESVRNFWEGVYFRRWFWLKRCNCCM